MIAANVLRVTCRSAIGTPWTTHSILDVRQPEELVVESVPGAVNIPLPQLRTRLNELPRDREIHVNCRSAQRAYYAVRILYRTGSRLTIFPAACCPGPCIQWVN